jgi:hypothetical protein
MMLALSKNQISRLFDGSQSSSARAASTVVRTVVESVTVFRYS